MSPAKLCRNCNQTFASYRDIARHAGKWRVCDKEYFWFQCKCGSTLILRNYDLPWFHLDFNDSNDKTGSILMRMLKPENFPRLPQSYLKIQQLMTKPHASAQDFGLALREDPVLAAGILKLANDFRRRQGQAIHSLEHAVVYIGRETVKQIALLAAVSSLKIKTQLFNAKHFWEESILTGQIAEYISGRFSQQATPDEAYLAGSLINLGKFIMAVFEPNVIDEIIRNVQHEKEIANWRTVESETSDFDHSKVGEYAANHLGMPKFIAQAIEQHHDVPVLLKKRPKGLSTPEVASLANQMLHIVKERPGRIDHDVLNGFMKVLNLKEDDIAALAADISEATLNASARSSHKIATSAGTTKRRAS